MDIRTHDHAIRRIPDDRSLTEGELRYLLLLAVAGLREDGRVPDEYRAEYEATNAVAPPWLTGLGLTFGGVGSRLRKGEK